MLFRCFHQSSLAYLLPCWMVQGRCSILNVWITLTINRLRDSWYGALETAQNDFRQLLTSHSSPEWRRINDSHHATNGKGKGRASSTPQPSNVVLHRKVIKTGTVYRAVLDVPLGENGIPSLDACKAVLTTPELRQEWDPAVEAAHLVELCDQVTRIVKTNFTLGWPARYAAYYS